MATAASGSGLELGHRLSSATAGALPPFAAHERRNQQPDEQQHGDTADSDHDEEHRRLTGALALAAWPLAGWPAAMDRREPVSSSAASGSTLLEVVKRGAVCAAAGFGAGQRTTRFLRPYRTAARPMLP